jgi:hypothetical protein
MSGVGGWVQVRNVTLRTVPLGEGVGGGGRDTLFKEKGQISREQKIRCFSQYR